MKTFKLFLTMVGMFFLVSFPAQAGVRILTATDKPVVLAGQDNDIVVKVGFLGESDQKVNRPPLNIAIVLDKSGSMNSDQKLENAKSGAIEIVERLSPNDIFSLVVYDNYPRVLIAAQQVFDKESIIATISDITAGGSTALYAGVVAGQRELQKQASDEYINRIILLSDGLANVGPSRTEDIVNLSRGLSENQIVVTTIGVGLDYNEDLMTALARESDGNSYFARNASELPQIFAQEIGETMTILAQDIEIDFDCDQYSVPRRILGRTGQLNGQRIQARIDNLYGKNEKYALFEVSVPAKKHGTNYRVGTVNVRYKDPLSKKTYSVKEEVSIRYDSDGVHVVKSQDKAVLKQVALIRSSEIKNEVIHLSDQGKYKDAERLLMKNKLDLEKAAQACDNDAQIKYEADRSASYSVGLGKTKGFTKEQRKAVMSSSYSQQSQQSSVQTW